MNTGSLEKARSRWKTFEVLEKDGDGEYTVAPLSRALRLHAPQALSAVQKMKRVEEFGFHEARRLMHVAGMKRKKAIVRPDKKEPPIWELKCTPHAWRLFFYIFEKLEDKRIIYLHADYKNTTQQDAGEVSVARRRRGASGHPVTQEFEFPGGSVQQSGVQPRLG